MRSLITSEPGRYEPLEIMILAEIEDLRSKAEAPPVAAAADPQAERAAEHGLRARALIPMAQASLHLPFAVSAFSDFYSSLQLPYSS